HVTNRADVHVRLITLKLLLGHIVASLPSLYRGYSVPVWLKHFRIARIAAHGLTIDPVAR
ncbi:MAG: hypothetical protein AAFP81_18710, partial [Pseudomonadota bacterium]